MRGWLKTWFRVALVATALWGIILWIKMEADWGLRDDKVVAIFLAGAAFILVVAAGVPWVIAGFEKRLTEKLNPPFAKTD